VVTLDKLTLIVNISASDLQGNCMAFRQIGAVIATVTGAVVEKQAPAVPINHSVQRDHIACPERRVPREDPEAVPTRRSRPDARRLPGKVGAAARLSDRRACLQ
jgi:hypothetical protein